MYTSLRNILQKYRIITVSQNDLTNLILKSIKHMRNSVIAMQKIRNKIW